MNQHTPIEVRFWKSVTKTGSCWNWTGNTYGIGSGRNYGKLNVNGRQTRAHRFSYELAKGPIPDGLVIDHLCMNTLCVNPSHLEAVTTQENTRRWNATITHCKHGHPFDEANTHWTPNGRRVCRKCGVAKSARHSPKVAHRYTNVVCICGAMSARVTRDDGSFGTCRHCGGQMMKWGTQPVTRKRSTKRIAALRQVGGAK